MKSYFLNMNPAATYLPGGLPPKYCQRKQSLRPCSGWERVGSCRLATRKSGKRSVPLRTNLETDTLKVTYR